jgi:hypothetical protein
LQLIIYGVLNDNRLRWLRLCSVPISFGFIQLCRQRLLKPPLTDGLL